MNILYCGDGNILDGLFLSALSVAKHVSEPLQLFVITMTYGGRNALHPEQLRPLENRLRQEHRESSITLLDVTDAFLREVPAPNTDTRFTPYCMLRLFADGLPEIPEKILYLDCDVVCRKDITALYRVDISDVELAGVLDYYGSHFFRRKLLKRDYVNSGVLLLNMKKIRQTGLFSRCRTLCATKRMFMPDQSAINKLAKKKKLMPRRYNEQRRLREDTCLQHFTTSFRLFPYFHSVTVKPWQTDRLHKVLKIYEYDGILEECRLLKKELLTKPL